MLSGAFDADVFGQDMNSSNGESATIVSLDESIRNISRLPLKRREHFNLIFHLDLAGTGPERNLCGSACKLMSPVIKCVR
jgi:hypothetical protein